MTIDGAIKHAREVAEENRKQETLENQCELFWNAQKCRRCAEEHEQLANWLEELKELKQEEYDNTQFQLMAYEDGYNKAIDDVLEKAKEIQLEQIDNLNKSSRRNGKMWARYMITYLGHIQNACTRLIKEQLRK